MYVVTVTFVTAPEHRDAFAKEMNTQAENSLEREPACLRFDVCRNPEDPDTTFLYEIYEDAMKSTRTRRRSRSIWRVTTSRNSTLRSPAGSIRRR